MALADYQSLVDSMVRDPDGNIAAGERDQAIDLAVIRYSQDRPVETAEGVVSAGGNLLDLPAGFVDGFSDIQAIEIPPDQFPPARLANEAWAPYMTLTGVKIMLESPLQAGGTARIFYTLPHTLDGASDTIPTRHMEPVACWAAAILLEQLASLYAGDSLPTIDTDSVDHQAKSRDYAGRAKTARKRYFDELGIDPKRNAAAGTFVNMSLQQSGGRGFMFKRQSRR